MTTASLTAGAGTMARAPTNKWLVTISVTFGTLMGTIDSSIVNVAIPHLRGAVGASITEITWVSTGFVIATVIVLVVSPAAKVSVPLVAVKSAAVAVFVAVA